MNNRVDVDFAESMVPHAEQGAAMSVLVLGDAGVDPGVRALAASVAASQRGQSEELRRWLLVRGRPVPPPLHSASGAGGGGGMATGKQLRALGRADGAAAERLYLQLMIRHHRGAVAAARKQVSRGQDATLVDVAHRLSQTSDVQLEALREAEAALPPLVPGLTPPSGRVTSG